MLKTLPYDTIDVISGFLEITDFMALKHTCALTFQLTNEKWETTLENYNKPHDFWKIIVKNGWLDLIRFIANSERYKLIMHDVSLCNLLAKYGHLDALKWARANGLYWTDDTCTYAASGGHLAVLKWLRDENNGFGICRWDKRTFSAAEKGGHLHVLKWMHGSFENPWNYLLHYQAAALDNGIEILRWMRENGCPWDENACMYAASGGQLNTLKWLRDRNNGFGICPWDAVACSEAAGNGHLDVLKWLRRGMHESGAHESGAHESGAYESGAYESGAFSFCPWNVLTCSAAAENGYLNILQWLRGEHEDNKTDICPWDSHTCACAAMNGHLEILKWLRDRNRVFGICPWDEDTCAYAAGGGHLNVLKWLRGEREEVCGCEDSENFASDICPWDQRVCEYAYDDGHTEVLKWARENGCPQE